MRNKGGFTPREEAVSLISNWIKAMVQGRTGDVDDIDGSFMFKKETIGHLVKIHNKLLSTTKLDYNELQEPQLIKEVKTTLVRPPFPRDD